MGGEGHIIPYHQAVERAVVQLGWNYCAIAPRDPASPNLPDNWLATFPATHLEELEGNLGKKILRLREAIVLGFDLAPLLNAAIRPQGSTVIFLERFIHLQLFALWVALWRVPTSNLSVWLLYRRDTHHDKTRGIYKWLNQKLARQLGGDLQLLTDSDLLGQSLSDYFSQPVTVMPIPHTEVLDAGREQLRSPYLLCWWAGAPRLEKGWNRIRALVETKTEFAERLCLLVAERANLSAREGGMKVKSIPDHLSRPDYLYWLARCDVILLPYDTEAYKERTSGIFTECIIAGKLPVVTPQTWMARELAGYDLGELAIDWENPEVAIAQIVQRATDDNLRSRLKQMQATYRQRHNSTCFAEQLRALCLKSFHA